MVAFYYGIFCFYYTIYFFFLYCIFFGKTPQFACADVDDMSEHQKTLCFMGQTAHVHDHGFHLATRSLATCALNVTTTTTSSLSTSSSSSSSTSSTSSSSSTTSSSTSSSSSTLNETLKKPSMKPWRNPKETLKKP